MLCGGLRARADAFVSVSFGGFSPDPVNIVAGEAVFWIDVDDGGYIIFGEPPATWSADTGGNNGILFTQPGVYRYYDDYGDFGTVIVAVNTPPSVTITNPANQAVFTAPASFTFGANASDSDSDGLSDVEFYVDTNLVDDVFFGAPFTTAVANLAAGSHTLSVIAYDVAGATATNSITITVQNS
ncbi:MAG: peptidase domain protein [Pedosphaera sp.]|nr:peptidase domain protein [Pedosphaera sp.]